MTMKRFALTAALLLAGLVGTAYAQVATTDLVPAAPEFIHPFASGFNGANITPDNPAAVAWGMPSRVAAGYLTGSDDDKNTPPSRDLKGEFFGARLVGEMFGVAAEQVNVKDDSPLNLGTLDKSNDIQLSLNLGKWLALGVGAGKNKSDATGFDVSRTEFGASVRLNEVWYLGLAGYQDDNTPVGSPTSYKRNGVLAGLALRTEGNWRWYLAYDYIKLDSYDFPVANGGPQDGLRTDRFTVQLNVMSFLIGASTSKVKPLEAGPQPDIKHTAFDIGWAPMMGLTVSARVQKTDVTGGGLLDDTVKTNSLAVAWQF
jgi:opacity protein-like surface antigen